MKFNLKLKICLWKRYFDTGMGLTSYIKYIIAFYGLASREVSNVLFLALGYAVASFILGWIWLNTDFYTAETEVSNQFNPFVAEMRKEIIQVPKRKI